MGDYTKLIINCSINKIVGDDLVEFEETFRNKIYVCSSAYHCGGELLVFSNDWHHRTEISLITQIKYGVGIEDFINWLRPYIKGGFGDNDCIGLSMSEYCENPVVYFKESR